MSTRSVLDWLEEAAEAAPQSVAYDGPGGSYTWGALKARARETGTFLCALTKPQQPVLILMEKSPDCLCAMFGAVYAG